MLSDTSRELNEQIQNSEVQVGLCLRHERSLPPYFIRGVHEGRTKERGFVAANHAPRNQGDGWDNKWRGLQELSTVRRRAISAQTSRLHNSKRI